MVPGFCWGTKSHRVVHWAFDVKEDLQNWSHSVQWVVALIPVESCSPNSSRWVVARVRLADRTPAMCNDGWILVVVECVCWCVVGQWVSVWWGCSVSIGGIIIIVSVGPGVWFSFGDKHYPHIYPTASHQPSFWLNLERKSQLFEFSVVINARAHEV